MKKRIFIAIHYMELGGAEMSLIGLLHALDYSRFDVDLMIYSHRGELMEMIPPEVRLLPEMPEYAQIERPIKQVLKDGYWHIALARLKAKWQYKRYARRKHPKDGSAIFQYVDNAVRSHLPSLRHLGTYDLAISFLTPHGIVLDKVQAKSKAAWIHTDYSFIDTDVELEYPVWSNYNHIVSISESASEGFIRVFPLLKKKVMVIENILSPQIVRNRSKLSTPEEVGKEMLKNKEYVNILSVGRFTAAKNYDNVPTICRLINTYLSNNPKSGMKKVRWYLIGYGGMEDAIRANIIKEGMQDIVVILGKKDNPYPYIKACDIYAQPSRFEGKSVTVREAQILCKPVVITEYATAKSQVENGKDGIIVPLENEQCALGMASFIMDTDKQNAIIQYLSQHDYGNLSEVNKIDLLFQSS